MTKKLEECVELQYFLQAVSYFCAASLAWENRPAPDTLIAPVSQMIGQGVELTLKANLKLQGFSAREIFGLGHKLSELWEHDANSNIRECAYDIAKRSHNIAEIEVHKKLETLASLYFGGKGNFPLRYEASPSLEFSYSSWFVDTFVTLAKIGFHTSIEQLKSEESLLVDASELEMKFNASVWSQWRPKL